MFGLPSIPYGMLGVAGGTDTRPTNTPEDMLKLQQAYAAAHAGNATPAGRVARGFSAFGPQASQPGTAMLPTPPTPGPVNMGPPALSQAAMGPPAPGVPAPRPAPTAPAGPTSVGGAPLPFAPTPADTGQAANIPIGNNYLMPAFGTASNQGGNQNVIDKLLSYFKNKDNPSA